MNSDTPPSSTLLHLLRDLRDETTTLLQQELALAKAELRQNTAQIGRQAAQIAIGGFVAYAGAVVLLIGLGLLISSLLVRAGVDRDLAQWLAPAAVGAVVTLIGWAMVARAKRAMTHDTVAPQRTLTALRENKQWAQTKLQHSP